MNRPRRCFLFIFIFLAACSAPQPAADIPVDQPGLSQPIPTTITETSSQPSGELLPAQELDAYWVVNPTSAARLWVRVFYPENWNGTQELPALVLMPGGIGRAEPEKAAHLASQGYIVIIFDADGRGRSEGTEDYNGYVTQDGLAAVITAAATLPGLDLDQYGLVSFSYGVTAAAGVLARHPSLPIDFFIDWEGPVNRQYTTTGCTGISHNIDWQPCTDDTWWAEREALQFIGSVQVPYQRIQSENDHVQMNNNHAIDIVNAAVAGDVPWARLNEYPPGLTYDINDPPVMLPDEQDKHLETIVAVYARYIIENVLPGLP